MSSHPISVTPYEYFEDEKVDSSKRYSQSSIGVIFNFFKSIKQVILIVVLITMIVATLFIQMISFDSFYTPDLSSLDNVQFFDLGNYEGSAHGWQYEERVLFCVPLRDAAAHLPMFFGHMKNLTYPHHLIDLAFLVSDSSDDTMGELNKHLLEIQNDRNQAMRFGEIEIFEKDFGQAIGQGFSDRHGFAAQGPRRKLMAKARNWLWTVAVKPHHSFVYWRDADVETVPPTILEDLMHHDKDVIVPNVWRPLPDWLGNQQPYDLNSWQESDGGLQLAETLSEDACIVEGYVEYQTWRPHLAYLRDPYGDPEVEMELDGIGGVSILTKAKVFRSGSHFPAFSFEKHAETEAFGKLSKKMGYSVVGLPHYVIWHIYEPSSDDLKHMEWMALEEVRQKEEAKIKKVYDKVWNKAFEDVQDTWSKERQQFLKNTDMSKLRHIDVDWSGADDWHIDESQKDHKKLADFNP
ncbi:ANP1 [[Candida] subhashii]|uniref:ANP1 n=1 Tax=[Candida] subhashii TaxID=561895 RepID=A0A8J5UXD8_9ASCO|nr:ANP1 [[Candida] subhashii]KAG7662299.1 ANP1 [[Candida] subhashii]